MEEPQSGSGGEHPGPQPLQAQTHLGAWFQDQRVGGPRQRVEEKRGEERKVGGSAPSLGST